MARTLDRTRDFAENFGDGAGDARYHQDNLWFDAEGNELPGQTKPRKPRNAPADGGTGDGSPGGGTSGDQLDAQLNG